MAKSKKPAPRVGRPPSPFPRRTPVRHDDDQIAAWRVAAARAGMSLGDWMRDVLVRESTRPHHAPPIGARRG